MCQMCCNSVECLEEEELLNVHVGVARRRRDAQHACARCVVIVLSGQLNRKQYHSQMN